MKRLITFLLIVGVLAGAGFAAWKYWGDKQDTVGTDQSSSQTANDPSEGGKYLVIKEWGVRFLLPEGMKGLINYKIENAEWETAVISHSKIDLNRCAPISIVRSTNSNMGNKQYGEYYYGFLDQSEAGCNTSDSEEQQTASKTRDSLSTALKTLEPIPTE